VPRGRSSSDPHQHRVNPTRIGSHRAAAAHGADIRLHPYTVPGGRRLSRSPTSRCTAAPCTHHGARGAYSGRSMSFPCSSSPPPAPAARPWFAGHSSCASRRATGSPPWPRELGQLGVEHQLLPDGLWIRGAEALTGGTIDSCGDHRIAMAFAVAALRARAPSRSGTSPMSRPRFQGLQARHARPAWPSRRSDGA